MSGAFGDALEDPSRAQARDGSVHLDGEALAREVVHDDECAEAGPSGERIRTHGEAESRFRDEGSFAQKPPWQHAQFAVTREPAAEVMPFRGPR